MKGPATDAERRQRAQACQPYAMLPADRYGEWKVLDLTFTPQDLTARTSDPVCSHVALLRR